MLVNRLTEIDDNGLIYHYCSAETLLSIVQNRTIRFSDINMLNDAEENMWGYHVFEDAATNLITRKCLSNDISNIIYGLDISFIKKIDAVWSPLGLYLLSFVSCFSQDGDSLSQWRAYADDGRGFAIGFRMSELKRLPVQILDVEYDRDEQLKEMEAAIAATYAEYVERGCDETQPWFFERCSSLAASAIAFKNPAWRDEKEVRCQRVVTADVKGDVWTLKDVGGIAAGRNVKGHPIRFQARGGSIVPFIDIPFDVSAKRAPIAEIVMGPKCPNAPGNIRFLMGNYGYGPIVLRHAGGAYR